MNKPATRIAATGTTVEFEGTTATVALANMAVNHFDANGVFTHQTRDGLLLDLANGTSVLVKPDTDGGYVRTVTA